jgi:hypothetical protein
LSGRTLAQSHGLGNAKLWQNDEFPDSLAIPLRPATAVDKAVTRPYLCAVGSVAEALILLAFLAVEPGIAYFPLIDIAPELGRHPARHGELIRAIWQMDLGL